MVHYLDDDLSYDAAYKTEFAHTKTGRYWLRGKADQQFVNGWKMYLDLDVVSDEDFLREFDHGSLGFSKTHQQFKQIFNRGFQDKTITQRDNSLILAKNWQQIFVHTELFTINDSAENQATDTLWKLPHIHLAGMKSIKNSSLHLDWDADYVHYYREDGKGGHRLDLHPVLTTPVDISPYLDTRVSVGGRETLYLLTYRGSERWSGDNYRHRFIYDVNARTSTIMRRNFNLNAGKTILTHDVRPYVEYDFVPDDNGVLDGSQFDALDIPAARDRFTYGIDNFFFTRAINGKKRSLGYFKMYQHYFKTGDSERTSQDKMSPLSFDLQWIPNTQLELNYKSELDVYGRGVTSYSVEGVYSNKRGDLLDIDYRYNRTQETHNINAKTLIKLTDTIAASYQTKYSLHESQAMEHNAALIYQQPCWSVSLKSSYAPGDTTIMLIFKLANLGSPFRVNMPD
jgi:LPS-assembly protein